MSTRMFASSAVSILLIALLGLVACDATGPNAPSTDQALAKEPGVTVMPPAAKILGHGHEQLAPGKSCLSCHKKNGSVDMDKKPKSPDCSACHKSDYIKGF